MIKKDKFRGKTVNADQHESAAGSAYHLYRKKSALHSGLTP